MAAPRDELRDRRWTLRAAAGALLGASGDVEASGRYRGVIGASAALAAVSLTIAAGIGLLGHRAVGQPVGHSPASSAAATTSSAGPLPSASASSAPWQRSGILIVDDKTGTRYVFRAGELRPIRNRASALLILGTAAPKTMKVAHATLAVTATGAPIGISGAPDAVPAARAILAGGWVVCSGPVSAAGKPEIRMVASTGGTFVKTGFTGYGHALTGGAGLGDTALVVATGGVDYLIWQHHRYRVTGPEQVFQAWKWTGVTPLPIAATMLDILPAATTITPAAPGPAPVRARLASSSTMCVTMTAGGAAVHTVMGAVVGRGAGTAGLVIPGHAGILVRATSGTRTLYLVTDRGVRYPIANSAALASLGYRSAPTVSVPASVLDRLAEGPVLSRSGAGAD